MELAWLDNAGFRGPSFLNQNPSCPVWDKTLCELITLFPTNGSIWCSVIAKGTTLFEYMTKRNQLELS